MTNTNQVTLSHLAKELRIPILRRIPELINSELSLEENLIAIMKQEMQERKLRSIARRTKIAGFPQIKTLAMFDFDRLPSLNKNTVLELATGQFIEGKANVIAFGPSGVGKSHLSIAIGIEVIRQGYTVRFRRVADLIQELQEAKSANTLTACMKTWDKTQLLILDEFGYLALDTEASSLLFHLLSNRYEVTSTFVTTNFEFSRWVEFLGDKAMATALIDRFAHKTTFLNMNGPSYRLADGLRGKDSAQE